jgi:hypothetical protein
MKYEKCESSSRITLNNAPAYIEKLRLAILGVMLSRSEKLLKEALMSKYRSIYLFNKNASIFFAITLSLIILAGGVYFLRNPPQWMPSINLVQAAKDEKPTLSAIQAVEAARWQRLADYYQSHSNRPYLSRSKEAEAARLEGLAEYYQASTNPTLNRGQIAEAARWSAQSRYYLDKGDSPLSRAELAEAARLTGLAEYYGSTPVDITSVTGSWNKLTHNQAVEAARWTALAIHYGKGPGRISPELAALMGK